jgi:hypothetical protein
MTTEQLARIFKERYHSAPKGQVAMTVHLFGIEFADELAGHSLKSICALADAPHSYHTEINKGIRLAEFVALKK